MNEHRRLTDFVWRPASATLRFRSFAYLLLLDCILVLASFPVASALRSILYDGMPWNYDRGWLTFSIALLPVYLIVASNRHAYTAANLQDPFRAIRKGVEALVIAVAIMILVVFYLKTGEQLSRLTIALGSGTAVILLGIGRYVFATNLDRIVGGNPFSVILIADGDAPVPPGVFSVVIPSGKDLDPDSDDPAMYDRLARALQTADRVVVACPPERRMAWAGALRGANVQSEIAIPELSLLEPLGLGTTSECPSIIVAAGPLSLFDRVVKRLFDVSVAGSALVLLSPLLVVVAIWIKLDSPGPVLFHQTRIGRGNRHFRILKFRSMADERADGAGDRSASRDDDRITRSGRFIRKTSIDELPQLVNVLRGDMSIVGPRPHALGSRAATKLFWEVDGRYWHRHAAKPGLTGLAQVRGYRGATVFEDDLRNRLKADLEYLEAWTIWRDVKIILLTVRVLLHRNAY
ncbi:MAG: sugar transferase [Pseudomonadota bacterium]